MNKTFSITGVEYVMKGNRNRKHVIVECNECKFTTLMTPDQAQRTKKLRHSCGAPPKVNNWLTVPWVK